MTHSRSTGFVPLALSLLTTMTACVEQGLDDGGADAPSDTIVAGEPTPLAIGGHPGGPTTGSGSWDPMPVASFALTVASAPTAKAAIEGTKTDRDAKCERRTIGACVVERCGAVPAHLPALVPSVTVALGAAEVAWLSADEPTSELPPLTIGDTVKVISAGEPAMTFGATVPADLDLRSPTGPTLEVSGAAQQLVTWRPVADGVVSVTFASAIGGYRRATCDFAAAPGTGTIPAAVFAGFPPSGDAALPMTFMHQGVAHADFDGLPATLRIESRAVTLAVTYR